MNQRELVSDSIRPVDQNTNSTNVNTAYTNNNNSNNIQPTTSQPLPSIATLLTQTTPVTPTILPQSTNNIDIVSLPTTNSPGSVTISSNQPHTNYVNVTSTMQQSPPGSVPTRLYTIGQQSSKYIESYPSDINSQQSSTSGSIALQPHIVPSVINNNQIYQQQIQPQQQQQQNIMLTQQIEYSNPTPQQITSSMSPVIIQQQFQPSQQQYYFLSPSIVPSQNIIQQPIQLSIPTPLSQQTQTKAQQVSMLSMEHSQQQQQQQQRGYYVSQTNPSVLAYPVINLRTNQPIQSTTEEKKPSSQNISPALSQTNVLINSHIQQDSYSSPNIQILKQEQEPQQGQRISLYPPMNIDETDTKLKLSLDGKTLPLNDNKGSNSNPIDSESDTKKLSDSHTHTFLNITRNSSNESVHIKEEKIKLVDSNGKVLIKRKLDAKTLKGKQCPICGKKCSRPSILKTHYYIHTGEAPYKCTWPTCGKTFNVKSNMVRHMKSHGNVIPQ